MSSGSTALISNSTSLPLHINTAKFGELPVPKSRYYDRKASLTDSSSGGKDSSSSQLFQEEHHLPPLKSLTLSSAMTSVKSSASNVGLEVGVGLIRKLGNSTSEDSWSSMLPPPNGVGSQGGLINYSHMSVSTTQIQSHSLPPAMPRPASADFTVASQTNSQESSKMTPSKTKYKTMPASPEHVIKMYSTRLTPYELNEILNYPEIFFIGVGAQKRPGMIGTTNNNSYDDDQGSYIHVQHDHVGYRYEVLKVIGKGSFGQVVKAFDHKENVHVALKMVRNEKRFHRQAQEEIRILEHLRELDKDNVMNIIHMCDNFTFRNHTCITFELLSLNLYELIKKNKFQGFSIQLVRKFAHSLLQCLDALAKNKIIHCDMKPENVLLKQQGRSGIKVILVFWPLFFPLFSYCSNLIDYAIAYCCIYYIVFLVRIYKHSLSVV